MWQGRRFSLFLRAGTGAAGGRGRVMRLARTVGFVVVLACAILLIANYLVENTYGLNLKEYVRYSADYTSEEKDYLKSHGRLIYGTDASSPPLSYIDPRSGQYKGIVIDYVNSLSVELGIEIEFVPSVWSDALLKLKEGETDLCDISVSPERAETYSFAHPIYRLRGAILSRRDAGPIQTLAGLRGKRIILTKGDYAEDFLHDAGVKATFVHADSQAESIALLLAGKGDAVVGDEPVLLYYLNQEQAHGQLSLSDRTLYEQDVVLATRKGNDRLVSIINKGILHLKKADIINRLQQKWMGVTSPIEEGSNQRRALIWTMASIVLLAAVAFLFQTVHQRMKEEIAKRTEEIAYRKLELEKILENIPYMIFILDHARKILNANFSLEKYLGTAREKLKEHSIAEFPELAFLTENDAMVEGVFRDGESREAQIPFRDSILRVALYPVEDKDQVVNIIVTVKDVTKEKEDESKLILENKMAAIGELATGMAHEIRNPLGLIRSYSYLIRNAQPQGAAAQPESIASYLTVIDNSIERANTIISNLLNFSRLSGDERDTFSLHALGTELFALGRKTYEIAGIETALDVPETLLLHSNLESMKHILINLLSNAIDAMPEGGTLRLAATTRGANAFITVSDTGVGISEEHIKSLFLPFFTTKGPNKGTGLGLYIVYNEVQKLGGEISVKTKPGEGTAFTVRLRGVA